MTYGCAGVLDPSFPPGVATVSDDDESDEDSQDESIYASSADANDAVNDGVSDPPESSSAQISVETAQPSPSHSIRYRRPDSPYPFQEIAAARQQHDPHTRTASWAPLQSFHPATHYAV